MRFVLELFAVLVIATGCASMPLPPEKRAAVNDVAIAALMPDTMPVKYIGTTIFNNKYDYAKVSSWKLNEEISSAIKAGLEAANKNVVPVDFDLKKAAAEFDRGNTVGARFAGDPDKHLNNYIFETAASKGAKYVFIIQPLRTADNFPHHGPGIGMFCQSTMLISGEWTGYALVHAALWDVTKKERVFATYFAPNELNFMTGKKCDEKGTKTPDQFAAEYRKELISIAKTVGEKTMEVSGLLATTAK